MELLREKINYAYEVKRTNRKNVSDEGLVPMLRTGILALQLLPSNSIAGICIITDGCSDIYSLETSMMMREGHVRAMGNMLRGESNICDILNRLRNQTISCSFVQVTENTPMNSFGLVPNAHLMKFISAATHGMFINLDFKTRRSWPPKWWSKNRDSEDVLNPIARGLLTWSFQKGLYCGRYLPGTDIYYNIPDIIRRWHKAENLSYSRGIINKKQVILYEKEVKKTRSYAIPLENLISCHLREGFTVKEWRVSEKELVSAKLLMPWKPTSHIVYCARRNYSDPGSTTVTIAIEGQFEFLMCELNHKKKQNTCNVCTMRGKTTTNEANSGVHWTQIYVNELHNTDKMLETLYLISKTGEAESLETESRDVWKEIISLPEHNWQKWFHTHKLELILKPNWIVDHVQPNDLFLRNSNLANQYPQIGADSSDSELGELLLKWKCSLGDEGTISWHVDNRKTFVYKTLKNGRSLSSQPPSSQKEGFVMIRKTQLGLVSIIRVAFNVGMSIERRGIIFESIKEHLTSSDRSPFCHVLKKPLASTYLLIKYKTLPRKLWFSPLVNSKSTDKPVEESSTPNWHVFSYLHQRRFVWEVKCHHINALNDIMMDLFKDRLDDGFKIVFSGNDGPITLADEGQFEREADRMQQKTHDREDTGIIQDLELPRKSFADEEEDRSNGIKISTFHVATEVWVEPRRGNLAKGPPGCEGKNFLEIAQIQMTRDHQMIIFETTYNLIKSQCRAKKPWDSSFAFKDLKQNSKPAGFENTSGVKEVKMKYLDYSLDEEFENRMDRIFFMNNTHDIGIMLYHGNHRLFGFSLLESTTEDKNQPNPGNEVLLHQFHEVLKIRSDVSLVLDSVENMKCPIQEFLSEMLGIRKRDHKESGSTVTDYDNYEEDQLYDGNYDSDEDGDDKAHSAGSCDGGLPRSNMNNTPHWAVYARYVDEKDSLIITALPERLSDVALLECISPQLFDKINPPEDEPRNSDFQGVVSDEEVDSRLRKDSEVSFCRSSYTSDGILDLQNRKHRGMLPVLVTVAERAKVREAINKMKPMNKKMTVMNKCWKPELIESMKKQESVRHERNNSFSPFVPKLQFVEEADDAFTKYFTELEDLYNRSFVRGVYHTLGEKSVSSDPLVSSTDFHIALYEHCVPEEKKIVITDAILSWCPEWRVNFDEQMRQNEAAGDNMDLDVDEEGSSDEGSSLSLGSPKHENRPSFFMGEPKPPDTTLEDRSPPPQLRNRSIDVNTPRRQQDAEEELETAAKCSDLLYENIGHYFRLFADDQDHECSTFYFVEPDYTHGEYSPHNENFSQDGFGRDQIVEENQSEEEDDIVFEHQQTKEEQKTTIHDYDFEQMSCEGQLLATITDDEPQANVSDLTNAESDRSNFMSSQLEDEPTLHQPLFLQMEMQIWASGECNRRFSGETVPLKKEFFTSIQKLVQKVNNIKTEQERINRVRLDDIQVQLVFMFFTIPSDVFSNGEDAETSSNVGKIPMGFEDKINKTLSSIQMIIEDEIVAARRKQGIITSEILEKVKKHVEENESITQTDVHRHNLMCNGREITLEFVNEKDDYAESIERFRENLLRHGYFGSTNHGFSLPSTLFESKEDGPDVYQDFQFDLKSEGKFFYVTLTPRKTGDAPLEEHGSDVDIASIQSSNGGIGNGGKNSSNASLGELNGTLEGEITLPTFVDQPYDQRPQLYEEEDREVQSILSPVHKRGSRGHLPISRTPTTMTSSASDQFNRTSGESSGVRRMSHGGFNRDDHEDLWQVPNFWLIMEIDLLEEYQLKNQNDDRLFNFSQNRKIPVMKLYHHRRRADNPFAVKIQGERISYGTTIHHEPNEIGQTSDIHSNISRGIQYRDPNVTDADERFIKEIEDYIKSIVQKVNQMYLLHDLSTSFECHPYLVENNGPLEDDICDFLNFEPGEFACAKIHEIEIQLHPRITKRPREGGDSIAVSNLKKKFQNLRVKNRQNMFVIMERERIVYFFIDRKHQESQEISSGQLLTHRSISIESTDVYGDQFNQHKPVRLNSNGSIGRPPPINTQLANSKSFQKTNSVTIDVHGLSDDFGDGDIKPALRELERKVELVLYNATLQALSTTIHRNRNEFLSTADVEFLQPRSKNDKSTPEPPSFSYFFPIPRCLYANFRRFSFYLSQILESTEFQVFMTANHIQYERPQKPKLSVHSASDRKSTKKKETIHPETPFLRHNASQGRKLHPEEVIIFNSNLRRKNFPNRQNKRTSQHIPSTNISPDPTQAKIAVISYEVYDKSNLIPTKTDLPSDKKDQPKQNASEIFLDEAEAIIQSNSPTDQQLKNNMIIFRETGYNFAEPTIVFCMWMQDYKDSKEKTSDNSTFRPNVHGVKSMVYKSLSRLVRAAIFDSLMEIVVLQKPIGMNFDRPICSIESRQKGTKTCPKEVHSSLRRRKDSLTSASIDMSKSFSKKSLLLSSENAETDGANFQKSRGISFLKSRTNENKAQEQASSRLQEKLDVESGLTGALHNYYKNQFRDWIRKESKSPTNSVQNAPHMNELSHPTINFVDFSRQSIRVPSWKIFEKSCIKAIRDRFSDLWAKAAGIDDQENICRVFYRNETEGDFVPSRFWKNVKQVSGQKVEVTMFLRDNEDWQRCTNRSEEGPSSISRSGSMTCLRPNNSRNYAKFNNGNGLTADGDYELSRQSCAMLTLENSEIVGNPTLCLYMYNVSENLADQMVDFIKKLLTSQLVRYELLTAITKLKLGLSSPIQHQLQYDSLPSGNLFSVPDHRKSKKCYDYQDVVENNIDNLQKPAPDKSVVINSFCAAFRNTSDIPALENCGDPPTNHGRQFLAISESKKASKGDQQDSRLSHILHEWAETTKDGRLNDIEVSHADLQLIKTFSTVKHFEVEPIWFHSDKCYVINNPTRQELRKRNKTPPGVEVSRMRPRAKMVVSSRQRPNPGITASRRMNNLGAQPPAQFDQQSGRRRRQKQAFFELTSKYVKAHFPANSVRNIQFSDKDDSFSTISFQFCIDQIFTIVFEIMIDLEKKNTVSMTVFALNMALVSSERDDFDTCQKLSSLDSAIDFNVEKLVKNFNFPGLMAEVHLSIVFRDWSDYYNFEIRKMSRYYPGIPRAKESLFPLNFDFPSYLSFLMQQNFKEKLVHGDFHQGSLIVPYTHNIPAKDFFKYLVKDSTLDRDFDTKPIQFVELRSERKIRDADENRSYILLQREYDSGAFKTVAIIYHDDSAEPDKEEIKQLKLAYWIICVQNPDKSSNLTFNDAIALIEKEVTSKDAGLPKLFDNVGEKCYKDHLWKLQQTGTAALSDLKELLNNADVAVMEISHELDERLKTLSRLGNEWLKKLGTFIREECSKDRIQVTPYEDTSGKCRHLAVFNQSGDYSILILLTVSDNDEETRIRALLKDIPRGTQWEEISKAGKYRNSWMNLRTEIENFMVAITLFLVKTMLDD